MWKMLFLLFLVPALVLMVSVALHRHGGKKELIKLDLVQFVYVFVMFPVFFVWVKSFLFVLVRQELETTVSVTQLFVLDTAFSLVALYIYAFLAIHSLTKTFNLKSRDPLYDIFEHSEYYHLWLSHVVMYVGALLVPSLLAIVNVFVPLGWVVPKLQFYAVAGLSLVVGMFGFIAIWYTEIGNNQFMRLMKLAVGTLFLIHVVVYFVFDPDFSGQFMIYWFSLLVFAVMTSLSFLFERSAKTKNLIERVTHKIGYGASVQTNRKRVD